MVKCIDHTSFVRRGSTDTPRHMSEMVNLAKVELLEPLNSRVVGST